MFYNAGGSSYQCTKPVTSVTIQTRTADQLHSAPTRRWRHVEQETVTSACAAILTTLSAIPASAQGDTMDSRTEFTFRRPVELPGVTLPPGTYIFRFADATKVAR